MASFTPAGSGNIVVNTGAASNPTVTNVSMTLAATEYSFALPTNTRKFSIRVRLDDNKAPILQVYYSPGGASYLSINPGGVYSETDMALSGITIYFKCSLPGRVAEIVSWV
jgi:hypothetical protein